MEIPSREVYIKSIEIEDMSLGHGYDSWVRFSCECTKGTFIRSICHDAGEKLTVHACLTELTRTASGIFTEETAVTLDQLRDMLGYTRETEPRRGGVSRSWMADAPERQIGYIEEHTGYIGEQGTDSTSTGQDTNEQDSAGKDMIRLLRAPDEVLGMFGAAKVEPKDAVRLINGLEIERSVYRVLEEPKYSKESFYFPVDEKYKRLYRIYSTLTPEMEIPGRPEGAVWYPERTIKGDAGLRFIGLGLRNPENGHLWPEKIFI